MATRLLPRHYVPVPGPEGFASGVPQNSERMRLSSTRYAMLPSKLVEHLPCWGRASRLHIGPPALNAFDSLHAIKQALIGFRILDDELSLPLIVRTSGLPVFLRRSRSSEVFRLKSLSDRMLLAMSSMASPNLHRI